MKMLKNMKNKKTERGGKGKREEERFFSFETMICGFKIWVYYRPKSKYIYKKYSIIGLIFLNIFSKDANY